MRPGLSAPPHLAMGESGRADFKRRGARVSRPITQEPNNGSVEDPVKAAATPEAWSEHRDEP